MMFAILAAPLLLVTPASGVVEEPLPPIAEQPAPSSPAAAASERTASNVVFAEALGSGLLYSINYERLVETWNLGLRAGASYFTYAVSSYGSSGNLTLLTFPLVASYYLGWRSHHLQLGLGGTILYTKAASDSHGTQFASERSGAGVALSGVVGYRFLPRRGGISFGLGFTPLVRTSRFLPWGGADVGYVF